MITGYKSIKTLIAKIYRDLDIKEESRWLSMIEWIAEALEHIGAYDQYEPRTADLTVKGYKAKLPCDLYKIIQISYGATPLIYATGSFDKSAECDDCTDLKTPTSGTSSGRFVYTVNDAYIFTNFKEGTICLSYLAIMTDEDGFPKIPDSVAFDEALLAYVVKKLYYPDLLTGKINPNLYDKLENDWNYRCMQARGTANMPNIDKMESIKNHWLRLIPNINEHQTFFTGLNQAESIKFN